MASTHHRRWLVRAPLGLVLTGFGLSLLTEAALLKYNGASTWHWVLAGTGALVAFNVGLSIFGSAVVARVLDLQERKKTDVNAG